MKTDPKQLRFYRLQQLAKLQRAQSASQLRDAAQHAETLESTLQRIEAEYALLIRDPQLEESVPEATPMSCVPQDDAAADIAASLSASPQDLARKERYREFLWNEKVRTQEALQHVRDEVTLAQESVDQSQTAYQRLDRLNQSELDRQRQQIQRRTQVESDELAARAAFLATKH